MSLAKLAVISGAVAIALSGCGSVAVKSVASHNGQLAGRGVYDDPRLKAPNHFQCLLKAHLPAQLVGLTGIQVGALPSGATIRFEATPGQAQGDQIAGQAQGAEVIGSALLYVNGAGDGELKTIETCLAQGVKG
jgi:hypothetical protein